jgi:hypothetical protein
VGPFPPGVIALMFIGLFEQIMHIYGLYQIWPEIGSICNSVSIYTMIIQLASILFNRVVRDDEKLFHKLTTMIFNFYKREERKVECRLILAKNLKTADFVIKLYVSVWLFFFVIVNPTAWVVSWYSGEFTLVVPMFVPFTDPHTLSGYILNSVLIFLMTMLPYVIFMCVYTHSLFFSFQSKSMNDIYCVKLRDFGEKINELKELKKKQLLKVKVKSHQRQADIKTKLETHLRAIDKQFKTLIREFNDNQDFLKIAFSFIEFHTFFVIAINSFGMALSIVTSLYYSKAIGLQLICYFFAQVVAPCIQGTMIMIRKERVLDELWSLPWYELTISQQKTFLQLIHRCQNSMEYRIIIFGGLDMELFTKVLNGVYTYFMFLWNFTD